MKTKDLLTYGLLAAGAYLAYRWWSKRKRATPNTGAEIGFAPVDRPSGKRDPGLGTIYSDDKTGTKPATNTRAGYSLVPIGKDPDAGTIYREMPTPSHKAPPAKKKHPPKPGPVSGRPFRQETAVMAVPVFKASMGFGSN